MEKFTLPQAFDLNLMLASGQKIMPEKTLIIFDEIQDCPNVINSMNVACAGPLPGIALEIRTVPAGKRKQEIHL